MKFLDKSSQCPAKSSKVRLYTARFDPYSAGIRYVLRSKGIDFESVYINVHDKPEWYTTDINPTGQIPALQIGDEIVTETFVIYDYLEDKFPQKPMLPTDPYKRAKDKVFMSHCKEFLNPKITGLVRKPEENLDDVIKTLLKVESVMAQRGTDYLGGSTPNTADYFLWGWVELIPPLKSTHDLKFELSRTDYKNYWAWIFRMDKNEHIENDRKENKVGTKIRTEFFKSVVAGKPNVMVGL